MKRDSSVQAGTKWRQSTLKVPTPKIGAVDVHALARSLLRVVLTPDRSIMRRNSASGTFVGRGLVAQTHTHLSGDIRRKYVSMHCLVSFWATLPRPFHVQGP
eukprot:m.382634 g.382634  ORF g.382634 m.382634 type:complete len:102 (+) comp16721_c1_seq30:299-604(+)